MSRPKIKKNAEDVLLGYVHEQLALWEALRKLGFSADDIYAAFYNGGELFTTLRVQGKEWNVSISAGRKVSDAEEYIRLYTKKCEWWNTAPDAEKRVVFNKHMPVDKMVSVAMSLREKDITIPKMQDAPSGTDLAVVRSYLEGNLYIFNPAEAN